MSAGTAYSRRWGAGGFNDLGAAGGTPADSTFLNAVEAALVQLLGAPPTADGQVAQWDFANTRFGPALLLNKNIDPAAAIDPTKIALTGALTDAHIAGGAAIAKSKLNLAGALTDADVNAAAAIAGTKILGYAARAYHSVGQNAASGALTTLAFDSESFDSTGAMHDNVTTNSRITAPVAGVYVVGATASWDGLGAGTYREVFIKKNNTTFLCENLSPVVAVGNTQSVVEIHTLAAADYIECVVRHDAGAIRQVNGGATDSTCLWMTRVA